MMELKLHYFFIHVHVLEFAILPWFDVKKISIFFFLFSRTFKDKSFNASQLFTGKVYIQELLILILEMVNCFKKHRYCKRLFMVPRIYIGRRRCVCICILYAIWKHCRWLSILPREGRWPTCHTVNTKAYDMMKLTHCGLVAPCGNIDLGQHWFR